jgi:hypothetical protein
MKLNSLIILPLLFLFSCSKPPKSILSKINAEDESIIINDRSIATDNETRCLPDLFSVEMLKKEVERLEKKFAGGTIVSGTWKHLDLSKIPIPQANFLKSFGKKLGDASSADSIDYTNCSDVPCIINKIYGKDEYQAGYVHYLWYLKYNQYLSASNSIHSSTEGAGTYNGKKFPLSAYLYNDKELYAWWRLLQMNDRPFFELKTLKEIQRLPRGESFDFTVRERKELEEENKKLKAEGKKEKPMPWGETCGMAYSQGFIVLQDLCLQLNPDLESGNFYTSITHEMSHHVDYTAGLKTRRGYRSIDADYYTVAGFDIEEYVDNDGRVNKAWKHKPGIKLVSSYGGTNPIENFAETLAYFRHDGEHTSKNTTEEHFKWVSDNYFSANSFTSQQLIHQWLDSLTMQVSKTAFKAATECVNSKSSTISPIFVASEFSLPLASSALSCLTEMTHDLSRDLQGKIRISKPEGCREITRSSFNQEWLRQLKSRLLPLLNQYFEEIKNDPEYLAKIDLFLKNLNKKDISNKAFLSCYKSPTEEQCYKDQTMALVENKLASLKLPQIKIKEMSDLYLTAHPYADSRNQIMSSYSSFVASNLELIRDQAKAFWNECLVRPISDEEIPRGDSFSTGEGYMVSSMYNCLNSSFKEKVYTIVSLYSLGDLKANHPSEELLLREFTDPELRRVLFDIYTKDMNLEKIKANSFISTAQDELRNLVMTDFSWVKNILDQDQINRDCQSFIVTKISFPMRYHVKSKFFQTIIKSNICNNIQSSSQFTKWLESLSSDIGVKAQTELENKILAIAREKAKACIKEFPNDTQLNRVKYKTQREACLIDSWARYEDEGAKQIEVDPLVIKFKIDVATLKKSAIESRRRLQIKIIKEVF